MKYNSKFKPLVFAVLIVLFASTSFAFTSEFTTSPPETQNINQDFTVAGEIEKDYYWESSLESIIIQSKTEDSSTWITEEEKDIGCLGSSCSISSDTISHDTVEDVEYRIVAWNTLGNTVPYSPYPETVEFTEPEREVNFQNLPSEYVAEESHDTMAQAADSTGNLYGERFTLQERKDYGGIGWGNWETFDFTSCWGVSGEECSISGDFNPDSSGRYQLKASITASDGETLTKSEYVTVQEPEQDEPVLQLNSVTASPYTVSERGETELSAEIQSNHDEALYVTLTWKADGTEIENKGKTVSAGETTTVTKDATYQELRDEGLNTEQNYDLEANLVETTEDIDVTEQASNSLYLEAEEDEPAAEINSLESTDTNIEENEETDFEAEVHANENLYGLQVDFYVDGEPVGENDVSPDSGETQTVSGSFSWSDLSDQFDTGEDHELEVRVDNYQLESEISQTEQDAFFLAEANEDEPAAEINSLESTDTNIEENEETDFEAEVHANERLDGLQVYYYIDGESVGDGKTINLNSGETDTVGEEFSWEDLSDQFDTGKDHDLEVRLDHLNLDSEITETENDAFFLAGAEEDEPAAEINSLESTDTNVEEGESTDFEAQIHANKNLGGVQVDFYVDGEFVQDNIRNLDSGETVTIGNTFDWNELKDQFSTGESHDLEVRLRHYELDGGELSQTESGAFTLVEEEGDTQYSITNYGPSGDVESPVDLYVGLGNNPSTGWCKFEEGDSVNRYSSTLMNKQDDSEARWTYDQEFSGGTHTVSYQCFNHVRSITGEETTTFTVSDGQSPAEINSLESTDTNIEENEETDFEAEIHANEDLGGVQVDFYVDGEFVQDNIRNLDSGETATIGNTFDWNELEDQFNTGQDHDLEVRLRHYELDGNEISRTEENEFFLADGNNDGGDNNPDARFSWDRHPAIEDESVQFDASSSSDPNNDITQYRWNFDDGTSYNYGQTVDHTYTSTGTYDVKLRVRDSNGNTDTRTREIEVESEIGDCSITVGSLEFDDPVIDEGKSTESSVTVSNHGNTQDFTVNFNVDGETAETVNREISGGSQSTFTSTLGPSQDSLVTAEIMTGGQPCGERTYTRSGELKVVTGGDDGEDEENSPEASFSWNPSQPQSGESVTFDASSSNDVDGDIVQYEWFFGDGTTGYGRTVQHIYDTTGDYDTQLIVEDSQGNTDSITRIVPVMDDPGACSLTTGEIRFEDPVIDRGDSTSGSISVSNHGESQQVNVGFKVDGEVVESMQRTVSGNSQRTFTGSLSPEQDSLITAEVTTEGQPCGDRSYQRTAELVVVAGGDQDSTLEVDVRSDTGRRLSDARVRVQGPEESTRYTDTTGEVYFELQEGDFDISVSKTGYNTELRDLDLNSGDHRSLTVTLDRRESGQGTFVALVEDTDGNRLENAEITVDGFSRNTDGDGRATVNLDPETYSATAEKTGYGSWTESIHINRGQDTVEVFRLTEDGTERTGLQLKDINYPSSVCRGSTMTADVTVENNAGFHEFVTFTGRGLGSINSLRDFSLEEGEKVEKRIRFTNVRGSGTEEFTVTANNGDSDSESRTVQVESCGTTATGEPTDISMQLDYTEQPNRAVEGDTLKVNGFVDGANGRTTVDLDIDGETKASVRTQPDGYYQTWITAADAGPKTVTATAGEVSASRPLRVIATSRVTGLEAPVSAFEGQQFQVCGDVESQIEPEVTLERDGEVVTSKTGNGRICFEQEARDPGIHQYRITALTFGEGNTASTTVETLEMDVEAESFPGQIASVESGSGLIKVDLYNTNEDQKRYELELEGLPSTWTSQTEKQVILDKGERKTVYFYLTPQEEGSYTPTISVDSQGTEIYREQVDVITGGTTEPQENNEGFFQSVMEGLQGLFSF